MKRIRTTGFFLLCSTAMAMAAEPIVLRVNLAPGTKWKFEYTQLGDSQNQATFEGQSQPFATKTRQRRSGTFEVLAVQNGVPSSGRVTFDRGCETVNEFNGQANTMPHPFAGATITLTRQADGSVTSDFKGQVDPDSNAELFSMLDQDAVIMPGKPVQVGDQWQADPRIAARFLQLIGPNDSGGMQMKFLGVKTVEGRPVAEIEQKMIINKAVSGMNGKIMAGGPALVDLATGHIIQVNFDGAMEIAGKQQGPGPMGQPVEYDITGKGRVQIAGLMPFADAPPAPPAPADEAVTNIRDDATANNARSFAGQYSDDKLKVDLKQVGNGYEGTFELGGKSFPAKASPDGDGLKGSFTAGDNAFTFTASLAGDKLTLVTGSKTYTLSKAAANPLDPGDSNPDVSNPLAQ